MLDLSFETLTDCVIVREYVYLGTVVCTEKLFMHHNYYDDVTTVRNRLPIPILIDNRSELIIFSTTRGILKKSS